MSKTELEIRKAEELQESRAKSQSFHNATQTALSLTNVAQNAEINSKLTAIAASSREQNEIQEKIAYQSSLQLEVSERQAMLMEIDLAEKQKERLERERSNLIKEAVFQINKKLKDATIFKDNIESYLCIKGIAESFDQNGISTDLVHDIAEKEYIDKVINDVSGATNEIVEKLTDDDLDTISKIGSVLNDDSFMENRTLTDSVPSITNDELDSIISICRKEKNHKDMSEEEFWKFVKKWQNGKYAPDEKKKNVLNKVKLSHLWIVTAVSFVGSIVSVSADIKILGVLCIPTFFLIGGGAVIWSALRLVGKLFNNAAKREEKINRSRDELINTISNEAEKLKIMLKEVSEKLKKNEEKIRNTAKIKEDLIVSHPFLEAILT